jgi:predicted GNAT superfamily acetyltransferase
MDVIADSSSVAAPDAPRGEVTRHNVVLRPLASLADYRACAAMQLEIWGGSFDGAVSPSLMQVASYVGGLAIGAFGPGDDLVGFVFGLTGVDGAKTIHWSHVLGVRASLRNAGIGRLLKEYQRAELARRGIAEMYWTFDPLIAKNAHLNLNVLGARVVRYAPDMYGQTGSPLHHGLATDRLVVVCETMAPPRDQAPITPIPTDLPLLTPFPLAGDRLVRRDRDRPPRVGLEVPTDFPAILAEIPERAASWHAAVREHFQWGLATGYAVTALRRNATGTRSFYLLESPGHPS